MAQGERKGAAGGSVAERQERARHRNIVLVGIALLVSLIMLYAGTVEQRAAAAEFTQRLELFAAQLITPETEALLGAQPAGAAGHVAFLSLCDGEERAHVYSGSGSTVRAAFDAAKKEANAAVLSSKRPPLWIRLDLLSSAEEISAEALQAALAAAPPEGFYYGLAFDERYVLALPEAQLHGARIYDYERGGVNLAALNGELERAGRDPLEQLPETYGLFRCASWFFDEESVLYPLTAEEGSASRRVMGQIDAAYAGEIALRAADYLAAQRKEDGSLAAGRYPRSERELEGLTALGQAQAVRALVAGWRIEPTAAREAAVTRAVDGLLGQIRLADGARAYLYEGEAPLQHPAGNAAALLALTEASALWGSERHLDLCRQLGNGLLTQLEAGAAAWERLPGEGSSAACCEGAAVLALCRLHTLTGEAEWRSAAKSAADLWMEHPGAGESRSASLCCAAEIARSLEDAAYDAFACKLALQAFASMDAAEAEDPAALEVRMQIFELYARAIERGAPGAELAAAQLPALLAGIQSAAQGQLDSCFFPENAMYMESPAEILGSFMLRGEGCLIRVDALCRSIEGYARYHSHYQTLLAHGLPGAAE